MEDNLASNDKVSEEQVTDSLVLQVYENNSGCCGGEIASEDLTPNQIHKNKSGFRVRGEVRIRGRRSKRLIVLPEDTYVYAASKNVRDSNDNKNESPYIQSTASTEIPYSLKSIFVDAVRNIIKRSSFIPHKKRQEDLEGNLIEELYYEDTLDESSNASDIYEYASVRTSESTEKTKNIFRNAVKTVTRCFGISNKRPQLVTAIESFEMIIEQQRYLEDFDIPKELQATSASVSDDLNTADETVPHIHSSACSGDRKSILRRSSQPIALIIRDLHDQKLNQSYEKQFLKRISELSNSSKLIRSEIGRVSTNTKITTDSKKSQIPVFIKLSESNIKMHVSHDKENYKNSLTKNLSFKYFLERRPDPIPWPINEPSFKRKSVSFASNSIITFDSIGNNSNDFTGNSSNNANSMKTSEVNLPERFSPKLVSNKPVKPVPFLKPSRHYVMNLMKSKKIDFRTAVPLFTRTDTFNDENNLKLAKVGKTGGQLLVNFGQQVNLSPTFPARYRNSSSESSYDRFPNPKYNKVFDKKINIFTGFSTYRDNNLGGEDKSNKKRQVKSTNLKNKTVRQKLYKFRKLTTVKPLTANPHFVRIMSRNSGQELGNTNRANDNSNYHECNYTPETLVNRLNIREKANTNIYQNSMYSTIYKAIIQSDSTDKMYLLTLLNKLVKISSSPTQEYVDVNKRNHRNIESLHLNQFECVSNPKEDYANCQNENNVTHILPSSMFPNGCYFYQSNCKCFRDCPRKFQSLVNYKTLNRRRLHSRLHHEVDHPILPYVVRYFDNFDLVNGQRQVRPFSLQNGDFTPCRNAIHEKMVVCSTHQETDLQETCLQNDNVSHIPLIINDKPESDLQVRNLDCNLSKTEANSKVIVDISESKEKASVNFSLEKKIKPRPNLQTKDHLVSKIKNQKSNNTRQELQKVHNPSQMNANSTVLVDISESKGKAPVKFSSEKTIKNRLDLQTQNHLVSIIKNQKSNNTRPEPFHSRDNELKTVNITNEVFKAEKISKVFKRSLNIQRNMHTIDTIPEENPDDDDNSYRCDSSHINLDSNSLINISGISICGKPSQFKEKQSQYIYICVDINTEMNGNGMRQNNPIEGDLSEISGWLHSPSKLNANEDKLAHFKSTNKNVNEIHCTGFNHDIGYKLSGGSFRFKKDRLKKEFLEKHSKSREMHKKENVYVSSVYQDPECELDQNLNAPTFENNMDISASDEGHENTDLSEFYEENRKYRNQANRYESISNIENRKAKVVNNDIVNERNPFNDASPEPISASLIDSEIQKIRKNGLEFDLIPLVSIGDDTFETYVPSKKELRRANLRQNPRQYELGEIKYDHDERKHSVSYNKNDINVTSSISIRMKEKTPLRNIDDCRLTKDCNETGKNTTKSTGNGMEIEMYSNLIVAGKRTNDCEDSTCFNKIKENSDSNKNIELVNKTKLIYTNSESHLVSLDNKIAMTNQSTAEKNDETFIPDAQQPFNVKESPPNDSSTILSPNISRQPKLKKVVFDDSTFSELPSIEETILNHVEDDTHRIKYHASETCDNKNDIDQTKENIPFVNERRRPMNSRKKSLADRRSDREYMATVERLTPCEESLAQKRDDPIENIPTISFKNELMPKGIGNDNETATQCLGNMKGNKVEFGYSTLEKTPRFNSACVDVDEPVTSCEDNTRASVTIPVANCRNNGLKNKKESESERVINDQMNSILFSENLKNNEFEFGYPTTVKGSRSKYDFIAGDEFWKPCKENKYSKRNEDICNRPKLVQRDLNLLNDRKPMLTGIRNYCFSDKLPYDRVSDENLRCDERHALPSHFQMCSRPPIKCTINKCREIRSERYFNCENCQPNCIKRNRQCHRICQRIPSIGRNGSIQYFVKGVPSCLRSPNVACKSRIIEDVYCRPINGFQKQEANQNSSDGGGTVGVTHSFSGNASIEQHDITCGQMENENARFHCCCMNNSSKECQIMLCCPNSSPNIRKVPANSFCNYLVPDTPRRNGFNVGSRSVPSCFVPICERNHCCESKPRKRLDRFNFINKNKPLERKYIMRGEGKYMKPKWMFSKAKIIPIDKKMNMVYVSNEIGNYPPVSATTTTTQNDFEETPTINAVEFGYSSNVGTTKTSNSAKCLRLSVEIEKNIIIPVISNSKVKSVKNPSKICEKKFCIPIPFIKECKTKPIMNSFRFCRKYQVPCTIDSNKLLISQNFGVNKFICLKNTQMLFNQPTEFCAKNRNRMKYSDKCFKPLISEPFFPQCPTADDHCRRNFKCISHLSPTEPIRKFKQCPQFYQQYNCDITNKDGPLRFDNMFTKIRALQNSNEADTSSPSSESTGSLEDSNEAIISARNNYSNANQNSLNHLCCNTFYCRPPVSMRPFNEISIPLNTCRQKYVCKLLIPTVSQDCVVTFPKTIPCCHVRMGQRNHCCENKQRKRLERFFFRKEPKQLIKTDVKDILDRSDSVKEISCVSPTSDSASISEENGDIPVVRHVSMSSVCVNTSRTETQDFDLKNKNPIICVTDISEKNDNIPLVCLQTIGTQCETIEEKTNVDASTQYDSKIFTLNTVLSPLITEAEKKEFENFLFDKDSKKSGQSKLNSLGKYNFATYLTDVGTTFITAKEMSSEINANETNTLLNPLTASDLTEINPSMSDEHDLNEQERDITDRDTKDSIVKVNSYKSQLETISKNPEIKSFIIHSDNPFSNVKLQTQGNRSPLGLETQTVMTRAETSYVTAIEIPTEKPYGGIVIETSEDLDYPFLSKETSSDIASYKSSVTTINGTIIEESTEEMSTEKSTPKNKENMINKKGSNILMTEEPSKVKSYKLITDSMKPNPMTITTTLTTNTDTRNTNPSTEHNAETSTGSISTRSNEDASNRNTSTTLLKATTMGLALPEPSKETTNQTSSTTHKKNTTTQPTSSTTFTKETTTKPTSSFVFTIETTTPQPSSGQFKETTDKNTLSTSLIPTTDRLVSSRSSEKSTNKTTSNTLLKPHAIGFKKSSSVEDMTTGITTSTSANEIITGLSSTRSDEKTTGKKTSTTLLESTASRSKKSTSHEETTNGNTSSSFTNETSTDLSSTGSSKSTIGKNSSNALTKGTNTDVS